MGGYGVEWNLGDWVSARFMGMTFDKKIAAVSISLDSEGEVVTPTVEEI